MFERICEALTRAGLPHAPATPETALAECGMDSLVQVMSIIEFEKTFGLRVPADEFSPELFTSISTIERFLRTHGVS
jgi:acyl carrier protein